MKIPILKNITRYWKQDLNAALAVSLVAIPQALAYATMAGLPAYLGLYALTIPTIIAALLGTSSILSTGPYAVVSVLIAATLSKLGTANVHQLISTGIMLAVLVGLIQIILGIFKVGSFIQYITRPVLYGFTTAAAIIILISQIPSLLGIQIARSPHVFELMMNLLNHFNGIDYVTAFIGTLSIFLLLALKKLTPQLPAVLIVVIVGIIVSLSLHYTGPLVGEIPRGFSVIDISLLSHVNVYQLLPSAFIIAIIGFMSSISILKSISIKKDEVIEPNRELFAQGVANISSAFIGAFPVSGSISRTVLNMQSGAKSKYSSVYLGVITMVVMYFFTSFLFHVTYATLAAIIIVSVSELIDIKEMQKMFKICISDGIVALVTIIATIALSPHIDYGILIGICMSVLANIFRGLPKKIL